jgi:hypothetical protein
LGGGSVSVELAFLFYLSLLLTYELLDERDESKFETRFLFSGCQLQYDLILSSYFSSLEEEFDLVSHPKGGFLGMVFWERYGSTKTIANGEA